MCHFCLVTGTTVTIKPDCFAREVPHLDGMRKIDGVMEKEGQMKFALLVVGVALVVIHFHTFTAH